MLDMLKGVRVVSFNHFLLGPVGIQALGDLGADVIAIEAVEGAWQRHWSGADKWADGQSMLLLVGNRNKRSVALDLKSPKAKEIALKLCQTADVVTENFRPGVMDRLGLGYERLKALKPELIFASASGFGPTGPYVERPGQDLMIQAMFGLAKITGDAERGPRTVGVSAADHHGAALYAMGILAALVRRNRTGQGCRVDVNLMQASMDLQAESFTAFFNGGKSQTEVPPKYVGGWYYPAPYGIYPTKDGHIAISLGSLEVLAKALGDPRIATVTDKEAFGPRRTELADMVAACTRTRTNAEWIAIMEPMKIWHGPVRGYDAIAADPQVAHNRALLKVKGATGADLTFVNHPVQYDGQAGEVALPPQPLGAQTEEVLSELGIGAAEQDALEKEGAIKRLRA
ncbi:MAG: CoA transferase [Alphaproteobacteria bacterium]|nr:CoA transferase [Alphaproteobacteria bacterium]